MAADSGKLSAVCDRAGGGARGRRARPGGTGIVVVPDLVTTATSGGEIAGDVSGDMMIGEIGATMAVAGRRDAIGLAGRKVCKRRDMASAAIFVSDGT